MAFQRLLTFVVLLRLSTVIAALIPVAVTQLGSSPSLSQQPNASVTLKANVTPFPVPHTYITLELFNSPGDHLHPPNVNVGISEALAIIFDFVQQTGDIPLTDVGVSFFYGGVSIEVHPMQFHGRPPLSYAHVVSVVRGISLVENQLGFATRYMNIYHLNEGHLGTALIGHTYEVGGRNATGVSTS